MSRLATSMGHLVTAATPSSVATLDFNLLAPFRHFIVTGWLKPATDSVSLWVRFSNDAGATFRAGASDYVWGRAVVNIPAGTVDPLQDTADAQIVPGTSGNLTGEFISFEATIRGARSTGVPTAIGGTQFYVNATPTPLAGFFGGYVAAANEVNNAVRFLFSSGNIASGEVSLFGLP